MNNSKGQDDLLKIKKMSIEQDVGRAYEETSRIEEKHEIQEQERKKNQEAEINQMKTLQSLELYSKDRTLDLYHARERDRAQDILIDAVSRTIHIADKVNKNINELARVAYGLRKGVAASEKQLNLGTERLKRLDNSLNDLMNSTLDITSVSEGEEEELALCQSGTREISEKVMELRNNLNRFSASLKQNPIYDSLEIFEDVKKDGDSLYLAVSSLQAPQKGRFAMKAIQESVKQLAGGI